MLVIVRGDPAYTKTEVIGLDIMAPRHPKLYALIVQRLGYDINSTTHVVSNRQGRSKNRVARWYIFEPKIPIWVNFAGPSNGKCCDFFTF
jgi:hypothetical protein